MGQTAEATRLLRDLSQGSRSAADELLPLVYDELRELAACWMARENPGHTLEATALVHEAYLRMIDQANVDWKNRAHFFAVAAKMIRRVLVDHARQRRATKRGGGSHRVELDECPASLDVGGVDLLGEEHPDTLASMHLLAWVHSEQGHFADAEAMYLKTREIQERVLGKEHPRTLESMNELASLYESQGRYDEAESLYTEELDVSRRALGEEHPDTLSAMHDLGDLYLYSLGRYDEAESLFAQTLKTRRRVLGEEHPDTVHAMGALARVYQDQGRYDEAEPLYVETLALRRRVFGEASGHTLWAVARLASVYQDQGRHADALSLLREALTIQRGTDPADGPGMASSLALLGLMLVDQGRHTEAESVLRECLEIRRRALSEDNWLTFNAMSLLGASLAGQGEYEEAEPLLLDGYHGMQDGPAALDLRKREALERIVALYDAWGNPEMAAEYRALRTPPLGTERPIGTPARAADRSFMNDPG